VGKPILAPSIWRSPHSLRTCWQTSQMLAIPVAAIGWPPGLQPGVATVSHGASELTAIPSSYTGGQAGGEPVERSLDHAVHRGAVVAVSDPSYFSTGSRVRADTATAAPASASRSAIAASIRDSHP
jgi:hypothetical protein